MNDILPDCMIPDGAAPCRGYHQQVARANHWQARAQHLEEALRRIAAGDGYYGAQAREYKEVARDALAGKPFFALPPSCRNCVTDYGWIRLMAWKTHRAKYGPKGHGGSDPLAGDT